MIPIHVVGIGLDGATGLPQAIRHQVAQATLLVGSHRHLAYFPELAAQWFLLGDLTAAIAQIQQHLQQTEQPCVVIVTSGDPLFFGLGRLLLNAFPAQQLTFHPHLSSVQLAFSRLKMPWQDAKFFSAHGRSLVELQQALQQGADKIAVLTDGVHSPPAIAHLLKSLDLPSRYRMWVCENLGGETERITEVQAEPPAGVAPLNVVVLVREAEPQPDSQTLPVLGLPDRLFASFPDRPGLMTKREVRVQVLAELALQPGQIVWDVGSGTGSVAIEIARLCPSSQVFAIEKTAIGVQLIQQNCQRFQVTNVTVQPAQAPLGLEALPAPDRVFVGGSGGQLVEVLQVCGERLAPDGRLVLALATLEHLTTTLTWFKAQSHWDYHLLYVNLARSTEVATLTRFSPLNPVTIFTGVKNARKEA